jgi:hypothetical protein
MEMLRPLQRGLGNICFSSQEIKVKWRSIGLWDVEAPTFSRQSAHRWRWSCQPYAAAALYPPGRFLVLISVKRLSRLQGHSAARRIRRTEKFNDLIANGTRDFPACSIVPQPTTLPSAPPQDRSMVNSNNMETSKQTLHFCLQFFAVYKTGNFHYEASHFNSVEAVMFSHQNW